MSSSSGVTNAELGRASPWALHLTALASLFLVMGVLYWKWVAAAVTVWWVSPTFSHCFLIIPVSAYLIWGKRRALMGLTPKAYTPALWLALPVIAASFVGALASVNEIEQLSLVAFVQVLVLALLGPQVYRTIIFPLLFLFFLVPMGEYLIAPLQSYTTWFIDVSLNLFGILHYTEGNLIQMANGSYQVAEACAGLRFLIATIAVGTLFAYYSYHRWNKIVLFMVACVIVPIIGNGFRALGIVLLAHYSDNRIAVGADHLVYGWGFSVVILAVLMWVGSKFADDPVPDTPKPQLPGRPVAPHIFPVTVLAALLALSAVPAFAAWRDHAGATFDTAAFALPPQVPGWRVEPVSRDWAPLYQEPDAKLEFALRQSGTSVPPVDVFVDYYASEAEGRNLISSQNKMWDEDQWHPVEQGGANATVGNEPVRFRELQIASGGVSRLVWWTFVSNARFTSSGMDVKLDRVRAALNGGRGAAMFAVSTVVDSDLDTARARLRHGAAVLGSVKTRIDSPK